MWDVETGKCVATLVGHSDQVRRAASAFCGTFVMMCLRCRLMVLPSLRTGGASCLVMGMIIIIRQECSVTGKKRKLSPSYDVRGGEHFATGKLMSAARERQLREPREDHIKFHRERGNVIIWDRNATMGPI